MTNDRKKFLRKLRRERIRRWWRQTVMHEPAPPSLFAGRISPLYTDDDELYETDLQRQRDEGRTVTGRLRAFLTGVREYRSTMTTHYDGDLIESYDAGRELAHRLTLRRFEPMR